MPISPVEMATLKPESKPVSQSLSEPGAAPVLAAEPAIESSELSQVKELERTPQERKPLYVALHLKLAMVIAIALSWAGFSFWLSIPWIEALGSSITMPLAVAVIFGIAIVPGYLGYLLTYQLFMSPVSVAGYAQELFGAARRW